MLTKRGSEKKHKFRSEHWVVVEGTAKVTINDKVEFLKSGESTYIPAKAVHRLENPQESCMVLIEIQVGSYLEEDDIVRYEDVYSRD